MAEQQQRHNPYQRKVEHIREPPTTFGAIFKLIGPGLILASSIVGSGELIATTVLGAENGYTLLWLIILSCLIKIVVQNELGRYAIGSGETTLEAFDHVPGPRFRVSWMVWCWFLMVMFTLMQVGGMLGGIAEVLHGQLALNPDPDASRMIWVWVINFITVGLLIGGRYAVVEKTAMALVVTFTALTVSCAFILLKLPEYFSWSEVLRGLSFQPPEGGIATAVAVFGITGVGATELVMYPYWCIEKGYASYAGPRDDSPEWVRRAYGWIKVMGVDVLNSMVIYTFATIAFYLLGAGVLNGMGLIPQGSETISTLSNLYTQTLGPWSLPIFLAGAVAVLYSTVFASTAAHTRVFADFIGMLGLYDRHDYAKRLKMTRVFVFVLLFVPSLYFMFVKEPVMMVKVGGIAQAAMLPLIGFSTLWLRYKRLPGKVAPAGWITLLLWISAAIMGVMMGYSILQKITG
ncbi:MAG: divalent metal cation transporter [Acidobacteria bacterium]|nr:divalent metal cation transporter [Acidobacteriota bacterium]